MAIEEKIVVDYADLDTAHKKAKELEQTIERGERNQTRANKKGISDRQQALRNSLASEIRNIRAMMQNRVGLLNDALRKEEISERQHAAKLANIRRIANNQVNAARTERGFDIPERQGIGVGAGLAAAGVVAESSQPCDC